MKLAPKEREKKKKPALAPVTVYIYIHIYLANYTVLTCSLAEIEVIYL